MDNVGISMKAKKRLLTKEQKALRRRILLVLKQQGFKINPHIRPASNSKDAYKKIQQMARLEQVSLHKKFLTEFLPKAAEYCKDGKDILCLSYWCPPWYPVLISRKCRGANRI
jgi:hypothetical protein